MGDQGLGKLTASLEELSLKKQLPLRQQTQKPMLKYSNSAIKPVQLFNHADLVSIRSNADAARNAYSSLSQASTTSTMSTPFRSNTKSSTTPQPVLKQTAGSNSTVPGSSMGSVTKPSNTKGHSNPYARPLSAKDIVNDIQSQKMKKSPSLNQMGGANLVPGASGTPMFGFPMNTFMRPQSAFRKEAPSPQPSKTTTENKSSSIVENNKSDVTIQDKNHSSSNSDSSGATKKALQPPPTRLEREQDLSETLCSQNSSKGSIQGSRTNQFGPSQSASNPGMAADVAKQLVSEVRKENTAAGGSTKVAAGSQTTSSTLSRMHEASSGSSASSDGVQKIVKQTNGTLPTKSVIYAKPVSSLPRPGSAANSSKSTTPDSQKVRNMNYTPTKPYTEVMNPSPVSGTVTSKPPIPSSIKANETAISPSYDTIKTGTTYTAPSNISKVRSQTSSATSSNSTMYYRKESKADVMIHEQRPPAIGAPAKPLKGAEKGSRTTLTSGSEVEEGDEESEPGLPSGERLPGDGEASIDGVDDDDFDDLDLEDDDDMVDDLNDDCIDGSDGESDGYSFTSSSLSRRSSSAHRLKSRPISGASSDLGISRPQTASPDRTVKPGLTKSHFSFIPPTVTFVMEGQKVEQLPWEMRKYLKWRLSPITPNVVKHCLARSSFRITKRNHDWLGCWGKHMKSPGFKALRDYQKLNHFPGSFQIGRKDRLWRNLSKMQLHFGKKEFGFFPQTYCLPYDAKLCKRAFEDGGPKQKWIIKPPASARGIGIKVINKVTQIPKKRPVIVQKYLGRPYLINDSKFDMRIYVYVSSMDPLRLYVFEDGLARFASMKYSSSMKHLANKFMHLTNYSVNKKNADYQANADETVCQGHKWSLKALWNYMKRQGHNTTAVWDSIKDLIIKTIICSDAPINSLIKANCKSRYCVHELFGFDILLDEHLKPWILEVNISPSLHSNSQLDVNIKGAMIKDLMNIAGFRVPDKHDVVTNPPQTSGPIDLRSDKYEVVGYLSEELYETFLSNYEPSNNVCMDKRLLNAPLSPDERAKHAYYSQRHQDEQLLQSIIDILTPDDIRMLTESIDEDSRKGGFQRVFPTPSSHKYLKYFETPRYYNLLLDQWVQRYNKMESRGIALLQSYCDLGIHLELSTERHAHQWNPPNATCHSYREGRLLSAPLSKHKDGDTGKTSATSTTLLKTPKRPNNKHSPLQRSVSQSSSVSSTPVRNVSNLVFSPHPVDILSPKGKAPSSQLEHLAQELVSQIPVDFPKSR